MNTKKVVNLREVYPKIQDWWLSRRCSRYYEDMPKTNDEGPWVAVATVSILGRNTREVDTRFVECGLLAAYRTARELALGADVYFRQEEEAEIKWAIRRPTEDEMRDHIERMTRNGN